MLTPALCVIPGSTRQWRVLHRGSRLLSKSTHDPKPEIDHSGYDHENAGLMSVRGGEGREGDTAGHIQLTLMTTTGRPPPPRGASGRSTKLKAVAVTPLRTLSMKCRLSLHTKKKLWHLWGMQGGTSPPLPTGGLAHHADRGRGSRLSHGMVPLSTDSHSTCDSQCYGKPGHIRQM